MPSLVVHSCCSEIESRQLHSKTRKRKYIFIESRVRLEMLERRGRSRRYTKGRKDDEKERERECVCVESRLAHQSLELSAERAGAVLCLFR
jgi:hypothetical protein